MLAPPPGQPLPLPRPRPTTPPPHRARPPQGSRAREPPSLGGGARSWPSSHGWVRSGERVVLRQDPLPRAPSGGRSRRNRVGPARAAAQTFPEGPAIPSSDRCVNSATSLPPGRGVLQALSQDVPPHTSPVGQRPHGAGEAPDAPAGPGAASHSRLERPGLGGTPRLRSSSRLLAPL